MHPILMKVDDRERCRSDSQHLYPRTVLVLPVPVAKAFLFYDKLCYFALLLSILSCKLEPCLSFLLLHIQYST